MIFHEVGTGKGPVVMLLGPELAGWWSMAALSSKLTGTFRVVLATWDGYGEAAGTPFRSIADEARDVASWIGSHFPGGVAAIVGVGMGGQVAVEALCEDSTCAKGLVLGDVLCVETPGASMAAKITGLTWKIMGGGSSDDGRPVRRKGYIRSQMDGYGIPGVLMKQFVAAMRETAPATAKAMELAVLSWRIPEDVACVRCPVLVTVSTLATDPYKKSAEALKAALPQAAMETISGLGRNELYLRDPLRAADLLTPYLRRWADLEGVDG